MTGINLQNRGRFTMATAKSTTTKKEAMEVLKNDSKPNDSLLEAVLSNKEVKKVFTDMIKTGLKK